MTKLVNLLPAVLASDRVSDSRLGCSASDPAPCRWTDKAEENGPRLWDAAPARETQMKLQAPSLAKPGSGCDEPLRRKQANGRFFSISVSLHIVEFR